MLFGFSWTWAKRNKSIWECNNSRKLDLIGCFTFYSTVGWTMFVKQKNWSVTQEGWWGWLGFLLFAESRKFSSSARLASPRPFRRQQQNKWGTEMRIVHQEWAVEKHLHVRTFQKKPDPRQGRVCRCFTPFSLSCSWKSFPLTPDLNKNCFLLQLSNLHIFWPFHCNFLI